MQAGAKAVVASNAEHGVAQAIEQYVLAPLGLTIESALAAGVPAQ